MDSDLQRHKQARAKLGDATVLYEDNHLLALYKPPGLLTQSAQRGDDNLLDRARGYLKIAYSKPGNVYVGLIHRLDRNVSGVVLLARTSKASSRISKQFRERSVGKAYAALVEGRPPEAATLKDVMGPEPNGRGMRRQADGKEASLSLRRLECGVYAGKPRALLLVSLHTGRKHQIRAQLTWAGYPLVGDPLYGVRVREIQRPALHALRLVVRHPISGESIALESALPSDMSRVASDAGISAECLNDLLKASSLRPLE